jgi:hypothetical protein
LENNCAHLCLAVPNTFVPLPADGGQVKLTRSEGANDMSNERMNQIGGELRDLCAELESLQARALDRVEELENDYHGVVWQDFRTQQTFIIG